MSDSEHCGDKIREHLVSALFNQYKNANSLEEENRLADQLQNMGFRIWDDYHAGYTIDKLNKMLEPYGLKIENFQKQEEIWFRIVKT